MRPVCADRDRVKLESEALGVKLRVEVASLLRSLNRAGDSANPFVHDRRDAVAHDSEPAIELERSSGKKAPTFENSFFDKNQPVINQRPQPGHTFWRGNSRARHLIDENLASHFNRSELQFFLGAEMGEKTALAHAQLLSERAHGEPFQALSGGDIDGTGEDGFAGAQALGLAPQNGFVDALPDDLFAGFGTKSAGHEDTVTHQTNKHERSFVVLCSSA